MTPPILLTIGKLADETNVTVSAIRYYDEVGLVTPASRIGGKRRFTPDAIGRISFVRRAQAVGLSLDDIRTILDDGGEGWPLVVQRHLATLEQQRDELDTMISMLKEVRRCGCDVVAQCPKIAEC